MKAALDLIGRVFLSFIFLFEAYDYIAYFKANKAVMTAYGINWQQDMLIYGAIFLLLVGGILLLLGYRSRFGSILLLLYWVPVTFIAHSFWNDPPEVIRLQSILFMKNIAITGGLLITSVNPAGKYSVRRLFATTNVPDYSSARDNW